MTRLGVVVLDADVLVPILSCDLLLSAFDLGLYEPVVTPTILDEVERTLLTDFPQFDRSALRRRATRMRTVLALHTHPDAAVTDVVRTVNTKDRHVAAVAVAVEGAVVASNDRRLRGQLARLIPAVDAFTADDFAVSLLDHDADLVNEVLDSMVAKRRRRPVSRRELIDQLHGSFPRFTAALRRG